MKRSTKLVRTILAGTIMAVTGLFWIAGTETAQAQRWEWVYGADWCEEDGRFRVIPVTGTCGQEEFVGGYIAVGTSYSVSDDCSTSDVYVVRTDNCGRAYWEKTYDITGNNLDDVGFSIIEVEEEAGFILTGWATTESGDIQAFLMEIDCMGSIRWTQTYGSEDGTELGFDLIEAQTGNPDIEPATAPGDIVVSGESSSTPSGSIDGYLFRTQRNGTLIWDAIYNDPEANPDEWLFSLTEAASSGINGTSTGDIVAVGERNLEGGLQGYVIRVSGDDGSINPGPTSAQNSAEFGVNGADDGFYSVIELQNPDETGSSLGFPNVVVAGYGSILDPDGTVGIDNFVVKLNDGNPCDPITQILIDGVNPDMNVTDRARTIRELPGALGLNRQYDLIMTGITDVNGSNDAYLLSLRPTLTPSGIVRTTYGGDGTDDGWSTYPVYRDNLGHLDGFVVCGLSQSNLEGAPTPDPQDMYLIRTDTRGSSGCNRDYPVEYTETDPWECVEDEVNSINNYEEQTSTETDRDWGTEVCRCQVPKETPSLTNAADAPVVGETALSAVSILPNPAREGDRLTVAVATTAEMTATITVTNSLGEEVVVQRRTLAAGENDVSIKTAGWPAGVYHITVRDGKSGQTTQVVITD